jgi:hypothetical protein
MSAESLVALVREVTSDYTAQARFEAMTDAELERLGLDAREVTLIRGGFFDQVLRLGVSVDGRHCCA